jgi:hypothetical protein
VRIAISLINSPPHRISSSWYYPLEKYTIEGNCHYRNEPKTGNRGSEMVYQGSTVQGRKVALLPLSEVALLPFQEVKAIGCLDSALSKPIRLRHHDTRISATQNGRKGENCENKRTKAITYLSRLHDPFPYALRSFRSDVIIHISGAYTPFFFTLHCIPKCFFLTSIFPFQIELII